MDARLPGDVGNGVAGAAPNTALLEYRALRAEYGELVAVKDVSFRVSTGEIVCIIGPNGAGKTTLLRVTSGLLKPTGGQILFEGKRIDHMPAHKRAAHGIVQLFQDIQLFANMSVIDNVMTGAHVWTRVGFAASALRLSSAVEEEKRIREAALHELEVVGLLHRALEFPGALSWGEQKLVGLARALLCRPTLLLLDEPYGGLDTADIEHLSTLLRSLKSDGMTILMVEHLTDVVMDVADRVVVLHYGEKLAEGTPDTIREDERVIATYLGE
ncbi:MAG: ABC transporter ATP-binding protein [Dehalococcoidia bacterium]|nr:ABC transporter ATP-binding protein [Dehalococcoidia bacterium]